MTKLWASGLAPEWPSDAEACCFRHALPLASFLSPRVDSICDRQHFTASKGSHSLTGQVFSKSGQRPRILSDGTRITFLRYEICRDAGDHSLNLGPREKGRRRSAGPVRGGVVNTIKPSSSPGESLEIPDTCHFEAATKTGDPLRSSRWPERRLLFHAASPRPRNRSCAS